MEFSIVLIIIVVIIIALAFSRKNSASDSAAGADPKKESGRKEPEVRLRTGPAVKEMAFNDREILYSYQAGTGDVWICPACETENLSSSSFCCVCGRKK